MNRSPTHFPLLNLNYFIMSTWVRTVDSDDAGEDEPLEEEWFQTRTKKRKRGTEGNGAMNMTVPVIPVLIQQPAAPIDYPGDLTDQQVIDNVQNLPDTRSGGKVRIHFLTIV